MRQKSFIASVLLLSIAGLAADWPQWRGPNFDGSTDETNLPTEWSRIENIAWTAKLPGPSAATPVVSGDRVFVSSTDPNAETLKALCFDRKTGELLWQHDVAKGIRQDSRSTFSSASPAADGQRVVFFFGNGDMVAYDMQGEELWSRNIQKDHGEFAFLWTFSSSPLLYGGKLYLQVLQRDVPVDGRGLSDQKNESYLLAIDPETGKDLWRHIRPSDAVQESREAFSTPIPHEYEGRKEILIAGGDALTGHDPETGKELWRWGTWNPTRISHWRHVPSPVATRGIILVCAPKGDPVYAIRAGGTGTLGNDAVVWTSEGQREIASDVPTPAAYDGDFFILKEESRPAISRVDAETGEVKWTTGLPRTSKFEASPLAADGKLYLINFAGHVVIVDAENGDIINTIELDEPREAPVRSSLVAAEGQLFIRLNDRLLCVGE